MEQQMKMNNGIERKKPDFVMIYGFPASGKTTFAKKLLKELNSRENNYVLLSADGVREELYGSQDSFGDGEEIYECLIKKMKEYFKQGIGVLYDACNLYKSYRMDFLNELEDLVGQKSIVRINTSKEYCIKNHEYRGRNFSLNKIMHYFDINEPPTMEEGWCEILDYSWIDGAKEIYLASPFFGDKERYNALKVAEMLRSKGHIVYVPLEHKIPNAWDLPNHEWGKAVFERDMQDLDHCDLVVCLSYGRISSAGTNWEAGYAYGQGIPVVVVEMEDVTLMSLMLMNGSWAVVRGIEELERYDFMGMPKLMDKEMEQK